ncbi:Hypothetical protein CINCED_3A013089 [Cinara cedri]|uniref:Uncharacterized protein n=1 Tax=Cinara cedri TaxID=506608 RepID=A0A5E4MC27_9HEMI|nr:Hypothetical protein CINCED_3A013089 [Cinara cedri]
MSKRIKQLFHIKTDSDTTANSASQSSSSRLMIPKTLTETVKLTSESISESTSNVVSIQKMMQMTDAMEALCKEKADMHIKWLAKLQKVQSLEELMEKANAKGARLVAENCMLEAEINKLMPLVNANDKLSAHLKQVKSEKNKMKLALSTVLITLQQYTAPTAEDQ